MFADAAHRFTFGLARRLDAEQAGDRGREIDLMHLWNHQVTRHAAPQRATLTMEDVRTPEGDAHCCLKTC